MDSAAPFAAEVRAFHDAARRAADSGQAPMVPSCPAWTMSDLVLHLGMVHRMVGTIIRERLRVPPIDPAGLARAEFPADMTGWPAPDRAPTMGPIPPSLLDWFDEGAQLLGRQFREHPPDETVWTWAPEQTVGFWLRMQTIEAAVHRWDAENALGAARPVPEEIAANAVTQTFEVMAPARRAWMKAPPGAGERFRFVRTDGPGQWLVRFDVEDVRLGFGEDGGFDIELSGTASDLMLFLWRRIPADRLGVRGDQALLDRYFVLVPPI
ncbi:maleylpyruvate isomerase family mycothiol-dependent enzyme [Nonomuraea sp. NPDC050404]|uniref:maleylpyruvate isomerase family mycothiol-dependent enzyme n=1 Tax=Nonomuraea sp. NPDC050404 TaxID=3155783 RepID=UPI00340155B7